MFVTEVRGTSVARVACGLPSRSCVAQPGPVSSKMTSLSSPLKSPRSSNGGGGSNTLSTVRALRASPQKSSPYKTAVSLLSSAVGSAQRPERSQAVYTVDASEMQWFTLLEAIRNGRKSAKRAMRGMADGQLLENLVTTLASDARSESLKCNLLVRVAC